MQRLSVRSRRALMAWAAVMLALAAAVFMAVPSTAQDEGGEIVGDAANGEALYGLNCAECHGGDGRGGTTPAGRESPPLADSDRVNLDYMELTMRTGRMPPRHNAFDNRDREVVLTESEQADILAFSAEAFGMERVVGTVTEGNPGSGLELYAENCAACHGATAGGGVAGGGAWTPSVQDLDPETLAMAIRTGPFDMPRFDSESLSDEEIGDIAAFMHVLAEERAAPLYAGELNPVFASGFVVFLALAGVVVAVAVAGKPVRYADPQTGADRDVAGDGAPPAIDSIVAGAEDVGADEPAGDPPEDPGRVGPRHDGGPGDQEE